MLGLARGAGPRNLDEAREHGRPRVHSTARMRHSSGRWRHLDGWTAAESDPETGDVRRMAGIVQDRTDTQARGSRPLAPARRLNTAVLERIATADRHVKPAALASHPATATDRTHLGAWPDPATSLDRNGCDV